MTHTTIIRYQYKIGLFSEEGDHGWELPLLHSLKIHLVGYWINLFRIQTTLLGSPCGPTFRTPS